MFNSLNLKKERHFTIFRVFQPCILEVQTSVQLLREYAKQVVSEKIITKVMVVL